MSAQCNATLLFRPYDADSDVELEARQVRCTHEPNHDGYHRGDDGMPFGPYRAPRGSDPA